MSRNAVILSAVCRIHQLISYLLSGVFDYLNIAGLVDVMFREALHMAEPCDVQHHLALNFCNIMLYHYRACLWLLLYS